MDEKFSSASSSDSGVTISDRIRNNNAVENNAFTTSSTEKSTTTAKTTTVDGATTINIENVINFSKTNSHKSQTSTEKQKKCNTSQFQSKSSPTSSTRSSCNISINSIDEENAIDSSIIDSESDFENDNDHGDCIVRKLGPQVTYPPNSKNIPDIGNGLTVVSQIVSDLSGPLPQSSSSKTPIGSIAISNATDVTFGDKHFYEGPVTVQQFLIDSRKNWKPFDGLQNPLFENDNGGTESNRDGNDKANASAGEDDENKQKQQIPEIYKSILNCRAAIITTIIIALTIAASILVVATRAEVAASEIGYGHDNIGGGRNLRIVPRDAWLAQPPSNAIPDLKLPAHRVIIAQTATEGCTTQAECTFRIRNLQTYHIESTDYDDIIYNFLIGGDGNVYEGRGWNKRGAHTKGYNNDSIGLAFIGTFKTTTPNQQQLNVTKLLIADGVQQKKLDSNYRLYGVNQLDTTKSLGKALHENIKQWPHWSTT